MSHILFVDESGHDGKVSPYEVLAGISIEDRDLWNFIRAIQQSEVQCFGRRYSEGIRELKGKKILKTKVFRHASLRPPFPVDERTVLARRCLDEGDRAGQEEFAALGQAKIEFVKQVLILCAQHRCRAFASIVNRGAPRPPIGDYLRKDYAYLFERFYYFLEDISPEALGFVVFDEMEKSQSHVLINQMHQYFQKTQKGQTRAGRVIPEPFFVHSNLTTAVQVADLVAYIIAWGVRVGGMNAPLRAELQDLGQLVCNLRYLTTRERWNNPNQKIWSFAIIEDLRPAEERKGE